MLNFIKRNAKFVIVIGISFVLIAGLTAALIVTNVGTGHARGRDRDRSSSRIELTEEQIAERIENRRDRLAQRLADGSITQEEYDARIAAIESGEYPSGDRVRSGSRSSRSADGENRSRNSERTPLTDEQIEERKEKMRDRLAQELADGNITQAEYNEKLEAIESGEFRGQRGSRGNKNENSEGATT